MSETITQCANCGARSDTSMPCSEGLHGHSFIMAWVDPFADPAEPVAVPPAPPGIPQDELLKAAEYSLRVGYGSDDCGDHCMNSCHWCELRRAVAAKRALEGKRA